jgi:hypothetical protein
MGDFSIKPKKINKYKNVTPSWKEENQNKIKPYVTPSWKEEKGNKMKPNVKSMKVGGYVNKMKDGKKVEVKDGKIIKRESSDETLNKMKKGNLYSDLKKKYKNKQSKDSLSSAEKREINKKNREKNYKNFNFENNPEYALGVLPAGKLISKIPGVNQGISKAIGGAKNIFNRFRSDKKPSNAVAISPKGGGGQGSGKFNPPIVRPNRSNKNNTSVVKRKPTELKKPSTAIVKNPNSQKLSNPFPKVAADIALKGSLLSTPSSAKPIEEKKPKKDFGLGGTDQIKKPSVIQGPPKGPLKSNPVNKKSRSNITGSSSYDADFTRKNLEKRGLKAKNFMSPNNFESTTKEKERKIGVAGNFNKGGVVKMRGGGAAIRGMNFNKGK